MKPAAKLVKEARAEGATSTPARFREIDLLALIVAILCSLLAYSSRYTLNPDGVSYLDLGQALTRGEWSAFVQGYWSPLYPVLIGVASKVTGTTGLALVPIVHALNALTAIGVIAVIWHWARQYQTPWFGRTAMAAFLLSSAEPPRVEAVTPDLLLLFLAAWLAYELLFHRGRRWMLVGALLGLMFLAKTSAWPWLIVVAGLRWWGGREPGQGRSFALSTAVCFGVMAMWIVPLSLETGHPTIGSAGRLNYCWYLASCDSQTPDTHAGTHKNYQNIILQDGKTVAIARFDPRLPWTYQPWGDPTAWSEGVVTATYVAPTFEALLKYWGTQAWSVLTLWISLMFIGVIIPMLWVSRRAGMWRELRMGNRDSAVLMCAGVIGIAEFVAVHAEPRLIAPFVLLVAFGFLSWVLSPTLRFSLVPGPSSLIERSSSTRSKAMWHVCSLVGLLFAARMMLLRLPEGFDADHRITAGIATMRDAKASISGGGLYLNRLVVVAPAMDIVAQAYLMEWRIVAQVRPTSVAALGALPPDQMERTLNALFGGTADAAWVTLPDGQYQFVRITAP